MVLDVRSKLQKMWREGVFCTLDRKIELEQYFIAKQEQK